MDLFDATYSDGGIHALEQRWERVMLHTLNL